ncbi:unnamed protein product [Phytophthora fragariaefolia]|uniref:Unnamed protein product n=1 Tax=Phytophthora fragariaefolia TaxID=1490495 RepID=A0A9W6XE96_9STRA|nr:unnamed protein product [Phytophthora fragariaefolia]
MVPRRVGKRRRADQDGTQDEYVDAALFITAWCVLRAEGWSSKPPPRSSLDTRYKCVHPNRNPAVEEGTDFVLGEAGVVAEYVGVRGIADDRNGAGGLGGADVGASRGGTGVAGDRGGAEVAGVINPFANQKKITWVCIRGDKLGLDDAGRPRSKRRRGYLDAAAPPVADATDAFLFKDAWRVFRSDGWAAKPPPTRSLDTRYRYVRPGGNFAGTEGIDYVLGEAGVIAEYMKSVKGVDRCELERQGELDKGNVQQH